MKLECPGRRPADAAGRPDRQQQDAGRRQCREGQAAGRLAPAGGEAHAAERVAVPVEPGEPEPASRGRAGPAEAAGSSAGRRRGRGRTPTGSDNQVVALSASNQTRAPINAKISNIAQSAGRTLIELPLGTRDGIQNGTKLMIYRNTGYVGEAVSPA